MWHLLHRVCALLLLATFALAQDATKIVEGSVVLRESGVDHAETNGTLTFWLRHHTQWKRLEVPVDRGHFKLEVPERFTWLDPGQFVLDGREAHCAQGFDGSLRAADLRLIARPVVPSTLRIVDARNGLDLEDVQLVETIGHAWLPLSPMTPQLRATSPYTVPLWYRADEDPSLRHGWIGQRTYLARARGTAWGRITIDPIEGGARVLALAPEAVLAVAVDGDAIPAGVVFELIPSEFGVPGAVDLPIRKPGQVVEVDGLPAGKYRVVAELYGDPMKPRVSTGRYLAIEHVELAAGDVREVRLKLRDIADPVDAKGNPVNPRHDLRGTLRVPAEWNAPDLAIELQRYDLATHAYRTVILATDLRVDEADPTLRHWGAGSVECGAWLAIVRPIPWSQTFVLDVTDPRGIALAIPPPGRVSARVVDSVSGADIESASLLWYALPPPQPSGIGGASPSRDAATKSWSFDATQGEIVLVPMAAEYATQFERVRVHPGENAFVVKLARLRTIRLVAYDGTARIAAQDLLAHAVELGGPRRSVGAGLDADGAYVQVEGAGTFAVRLQPIAGFVDAGDVVVEVADTGPDATAVFHLTRTPR